MNKKIEILSPAGDFESVIAAVQNGANAIYLGQKEFSARQNAKNFDEDELKQAVSYCHARDVLVYLAINTLINDSQIDNASKSIINACKSGVDALIVQDLGLLYLIKEIAPTMPIHASTQMSVHTVKGAEFLKSQGVTRVVLARELTLKEIQEISSKVDIETEVFVHGALCMSVSGQCYISSMIGTRSGNRGNCAGTCRLPFTTRKNSNDYDLSLKDMCLANHVKELQNIGVTSLKIEGRMKRPEYVAITAKAYNDAVNNIEPDLETVKAVFSRNGFTDGYLTNNVNADMFGYRQKDDVVAATSKILKNIANSYKKENRKINIDMDIEVILNNPIKLTVTDNNENKVTVYGPIPEIAINSPLTNESLLRSLSKLGSTPFCLNEFKTKLDDGLITSASALNELRRNACEELLKKRSLINPRPFNAFIPKEEKSFVNANDLKLRVRFAKYEQIPFEKLDKIEFVILPVDEILKHKEELIFIKEKIIIEPYRIMFLTEKKQIEKINSLKKLGFNKLLAENLAHIEIAKELELNFYAGNFLNCFNSLSSKSLVNFGAKDITLSFELELNKATKIKTQVPLGIIGYGYLPLMIMKNCPIKAKKSCNECNGKSLLEDRKGVKFRAICNNKQYTEILNSDVLYMADRIHEINNISFLTLYFTVENKDECINVINNYINKKPLTTKYTRGLYYRSI